MASLLSDEELGAVAALVRAVVDRDFDRLREMVPDETRPDDLEDLYIWTKEWRDWDQMTLVMPPGGPRDWHIYTDNAKPDGSYRFVIVDMWTEQEGFSDLSLEMHLMRSEDGSFHAWFENLHVM